MANALTKRAQIDKTQARLLITMIIASLISVSSLVAAQGFFQQANYLNKVTSKKEDAVKQLKSNKESVNALVESYKTFASQNPNLIGGNKAGTDTRDGDNGRLVLDALPSSYDFPALATSIEKLLQGYTINGITGTDSSADTATTDDTSATSAAATGAPAAAGTVEIPFALSVTTDYKGFQTLAGTFEKSIRPIQVTKLQLSGKSSSLQVSIDAKTFYQPETGLKIESTVVK